MQNKSTVLEMTSYSITSFKYEKNKNFEPKEKNIQIPIDFQTGFKKVDEDNLVAEFAVNIADEEKFPFFLNLVLQSGFRSSKWETNVNQVEVTIASILFPYVRALITSLTATAGEQPIMLPVMNVAEMIKNQQKTK
ncbi:MAG: protein-export chaperone SecB [Clostridia bacterium]|nr:protein-export chaperone SecB [Clostridia bacterium]